MKIEMKRIYTTIVCCFMVAIFLQGQKRIELNNQTPGWMSSLLTYPQQQEVEEIKVTGYINQIDINFLKDLTSLSLKSIDIYDADIVKYNNYPANTLKDKFFEREPNAKFINKFVLPKNIENVETNAFHLIYVDTLVVGFENIKTKMPMTGGYIKNLILLEGVKNITASLLWSDWGQPKITLISQIPNSVEEVTVVSFDPNLMKKGFNIPSNIINFGTKTVSPLKSYRSPVNNIVLNQGKIELPETCKILNLSTWFKIVADTLVLPRGLEYIEASFDVKYIICESEVPPTIKTYTSGTIICPKGCVDTYRKVFNSSSIQIEEKSVLIESLCLSKESLELYEGERYMLLTEILPTDATNTKLSWSSTNRNVVSVDQSGLLSAISAGRCMVIAMSTDGSNISAICDVTVNEYSGIGNLEFDAVVKVYPIGLDLIINGPIAGCDIQVYSIDGRLVGGYKAIDTEIKLALPGEGMYIVKINNKTYKVIV